VEKSEGVKEGWKGDGEASSEKRKGSRGRTSAPKKEYFSRKRARKRGTKGARSNERTKEPHDEKCKVE